MIEDALEAVAAHTGKGEEAIAPVSLAISAKRIADSLEKLEVMLAPPTIHADDVDVDALRDILGKSRVGVIVEQNDTPKIVRRVPIQLSIMEGEGAPLGQVPPGLYLYGSTLIMRTEYRTEQKSGGGYSVDAYIVESGEYFWGGTGGDAKAQSMLLVHPVQFTLK